MVKQWFKTLLTHNPDIWIGPSNEVSEEEKGTKQKNNCCIQDKDKLHPLKGFTYLFSITLLDCTIHGKPFKCFHQIEIE